MENIHPNFFTPSKSDEIYSRHAPKILLTADAVAERLALPKSSIYEAARQGRIGGVVRIGRIVRFDPKKLDDWLQSGGQALPGGWRQEEAV